MRNPPLRPAICFLTLAHQAPTYYEADEKGVIAKILASRMEVRCKCHGVSGSCQVRTCWRATPDFRVVASAIKRQYRNAMITTQEMDDGSGVLKARPRGRKRSKAKVAPKTSILFSERSPSFCDEDARANSPGTSGRVCRVGRTSRAGSCDLLCCGRGYAMVRRASQIVRRDALGRRMSMRPSRVFIRKQDPSYVCDPVYESTQLLSGGEGASCARPLSLFYSDASADGVVERSLVLSSRSHAWLRRNATMSHAFTCV
ncbi:Protein Wnt-7b [Eumeta japonica]|uniref:Protein Wnt n=1 Tax=Eumeta variegata TaxID=151549 RepID=A0A4C1V5Y0_EUMVA|nr:Protein Wnt-7b [Eumeta japonica]